MKKIAEQATQLVTKLQMIADSLTDYNPGLHKKRIPLDAIQYDIACLMRELAGFYGKIGEKIKNNDDL